MSRIDSRGRPALLTPPPNSSSCSPNMSPATRCCDARSCRSNLVASAASIRLQGRRPASTTSGCCMSIIASSRERKKSGVLKARFPQKSTSIELEFEGNQQQDSGRKRSIHAGWWPIAGPTTQSLHVDEINSIDDRRTFAGQYLQMDWKPDARWVVNGGLRLTETQERLSSSHLDGFDSTADLAA